MKEVIFQTNATFISGGLTTAIAATGELRIIGTTSSITAPPSRDSFVLVVDSLKLRHPVSSTKLEPTRDKDVKLHQAVIKLAGSLELPFLTIRFSSGLDLETFRDIIQPPSRDASDLVTSPGAAELYDPLRKLSLSSAKTASFFNDRESLVGPWKVLFSHTAIGQYRQEKSSVAEIIRRKLDSMSRGIFHGDDGKLLSKRKGITGVPVVEAKLTGDRRIVWSIDIFEDEAKGVDLQVIHVWGIWTHTQIARKVWQQLVDHPSRCSKLFIERRNAGINTQNRTINVPRSFERNSLQLKHDEFIPELLDDDGSTEEDFDELHRLLSLEKFTECSNAAYYSFRYAASTNHIFSLAPKEQEILNHDGSVFVIGRGGTGKTTTMMFKLVGVERSWRKDEVNRSPRQLFVTQSSVLAQKVQESYRLMSETLDIQDLSESERVALAKDDVDSQERPELLPVYSMDLTSKVSLPAKWSELEDKHFPLFVSFDQLCTLLEADLVPLDPPSSKRERLVDFPSFKANYWPHFTSKLIAGLDPVLVWGEILGVIKGSAKAVETGCLTKDAYTDELSKRSHFTLAHKRDEIYQIYILYEGRKSARGERDAADRTYSIIRGFNQKVAKLVLLDRVYVDEAQDNLIIDCSLIRKLLAPSIFGAFYFAADAAQVISAGSSFKFSDLTSHFYEEEKLDALKNKRAARRPGSFQLTRNYRSHAGICEATDELVSLLNTFFVGSVDQLANEEGLVLGPRPTFFEKRKNDAEEFRLMFSGENSEAMEFGADQAIIVRDEAAKMEFQQLVKNKNVGIVLTILQAKGLEFTDVLLVNPFANSTSSVSQWRLVLSEIPGEPSPEFDATKHASLLYELRLLYVAFSRARSTVWIWDDSEKAKPMRRLLEYKKLIQIISSDQELPRLATASTKEQWIEKGHEFFAAGLFLLASDTFLKGGASVESEWCLATQAFNDAMVLDSSSARAAPLRSVVTSLCDIARRTNKHQSFVQTNVLSTIERCFEELGEPKSASAIYESVGKFDDAVRILRSSDASDLEGAVDLCLRHKLKLSEETYETVISDAKSTYLDDHGAWTKSDRLFRSVDEQLEWMEANEKVAYKPDLLVRLKRFDEAASFARERGKSRDASDLRLRSKTKMSKARALAYLIEALSLTAPLGTPVEVLNQEERRTIEGLVSSAKSILSRADYDAGDEDRSRKQHLVQVFEATASRNRESLRSATKNLLSSNMDAVSLFAIDKLLHLSSSGRFSLSEGQDIWDLSLTFTYALIILRTLDLQDHLLAPFLGLFQLKEPTTFRAAPRSRLAPPSTKPWEEADLLNRTKSLIVQLRQERRSFALEHFRVSDSLVNTPGAPSSLIDLPSKASFLSLALMTSVVFHEIIFESETRNFAGDDRLAKEAGHLLHDTNYWLQVLSNLFLPRSLKAGSRTNLVVGSISGSELALPMIAHLLNTAIDELEPSSEMGPSKLLERIIVIVELLDALLPDELKRLVVASSFPQDPSFGRHNDLKSFEGNTIQLLTSYFGIIRFGHGSLEEFVYAGLVLSQRIQMQASTAFPLLIELVERTIVLLVVGVRFKESMSLNGLTAPLSHLKKITESKLSFKKPPSELLLRRVRITLRDLIAGLSDVGSPDLLERALSLAVFFGELDVGGREDLVQQCRELDRPGTQNRFTRAYTWPELVQASIEIQPNSLDPVFTLIDATPSSSSPPLRLGFKPTAISPLQISYTSFDDLLTSLVSVSTSDEALANAFKSRRPGSASVAKHGPWDPLSFVWHTPTPGSKDAEDPIIELSKPLVFTKEMLDQNLSSEDGWTNTPVVSTGKEEVEVPSVRGAVKGEEGKKVAPKGVSKKGEEVEPYLSGNSWRMGWGNGLIEKRN